MTQLAANWPFLLVNQIVRGKFFIKPEIAGAMAPQLVDLLQGKHTKGDKRNIRIEVLGDSMSQSNFRKAYILDDDESEADERESSIYDEAPEGSAAIIPLKGSMMKYGSWCEYGTAEIADMLRSAASHKNVAAIVLDIDSGGGAVDAIAPMVDAIKYAREMGKPVVASVDLCCSAAMWVASECDYIMADNDVSAEVGSIGVMMSFMDMRAYYEEKGIKVHEIYSSLSANKNLSFREARDGEYDKITSEELDPLAVSFQEAIKKNRGTKLDLSDEGILSGKTYFAKDALRLGLIDRIGSRSMAVQVAIAMSHAKNLV
jgi:protease-4